MYEHQLSYNATQIACAFQCISVTSNIYKSTFKILHAYLCTIWAESERFPSQHDVPS